ncbi:hypothetical protein [Halobaculum sp. D14]|uniref:hypothetical protein n=1 Tax=Halobaculum sp. D14 TaxID=3421642 RepID=UPI003EBA421E
MSYGSVAAVAADGESVRETFVSLVICGRAVEPAMRLASHYGDLAEPPVVVGNAGFSFEDTHFLPI